jgi:protocatechuate 3,4-dioxygenase beta subunit
MVEAVATRVNEDAAEHTDMRISADQVRQLIASLAFDEDLRICFNMLVMRARAAKEFRAAQQMLAAPDDDSTGEPH